MTYCVGTLVDQMTIYERAGDRVLVLLTAGNLAITQAVVSLLNDARSDDLPTLLSAASMTEAARVVGDTIRLVYDRDAAALKEHGIEFSANFILGGQIGGEAPRLFQLYAAGNYIEATRETPYFQIGESKYGKPVIDRVLQTDISMDSTLRSNLSVGLPLDLAICPRDALKLSHRLTLGEEDPYFRTVRSSWSAALEQAFHDVPDPHWD